LQDDKVLQAFDVVEAASGTCQAHTESFTINNAESIRLELTSGTSHGSPPIISGMAITVDLATETAPRGE
jgi:hypothetical protein